MISVSLTMTEGAVTRRVGVRAATIERALELAGTADAAENGHTVRLTSPRTASELSGCESRAVAGLDAPEQLAA